MGIFNFFKRKNTDVEDTNKEDLINFVEQD
jgi:hypothetical protein